MKACFLNRRVNKMQEIVNNRWIFNSVSVKPNEYSKAHFSYVMMRKRVKLNQIKLIYKNLKSLSYDNI